MTDETRLSVTGVGLVCSLALNAPDACAAAFAGLSRPTPMPGMDVLDPEEAVGVDLPVHAVPILTDGFVDVARFARLGVAALADLAGRTDVPDDGKTGLCIALPSGYHLRRHEQQEAAEDPVLPAEPYALEADIRVDALRQHLVPMIRRFSTVSLHPSPGVTLFEDEAGFGTLLRTAWRALQGSAITRCLIGGIDSHLDPLTIEAFQQAGLLLTPDEATGAIVGEAAAFILVETARNDDSRLTIHGVAQAQDIPFIPDAEERPKGMALSECLFQTRAMAPVPIQTLYTSFSGPTHQAFDWGCAQVRLRADGPFEPQVIHPATAVGNIGAATGPLAVSLAEHEHRRGRGKASAVWLASDMGLRSSFRLS